MSENAAEKNYILTVETPPPDSPRYYVTLDGRLFTLPPKPEVEATE